MEQTCQGQLWIKTYLGAEVLEVVVEGHFAADVEQQVQGVHGFVGGEEGDRLAREPCACRPARAVDEDLRFGREVVLDHPALIKGNYHARHVQAPAGQVGHHQDVLLHGFELSQASTS